MQHYRACSQNCTLHVGVSTPTCMNRNSGVPFQYRRVNLVHSLVHYTRHCVHQCTSVYTSVHQCTPVYISVHQCTPVYISVHQCTSVYISVHQCTSVYISVHQCTPVHTSVHQCTSVYISVHQCTSVYISVHQCTPVYISVHQCTSVYMQLSLHVKPTFHKVKPFLHKFKSSTCQLLTLLLHPPLTLCGYSNRCHPELIPSLLFPSVNNHSCPWPI